ncbi:MAG: N-acetylneuraminate synthase family protein [Verrucomicrobia bacterium]|nr:N-acetylneuraminate synthase family protein [Verrucomicrobiota bacterium]
MAEIGINHNGDLELAHKMIDAAADSGADAIKFQTIDADASYVPGTPSHKTFSGAGFNLEQYKGLVDHARERKVIFFTTPGDWPSLEIVKALSLPAVKISSGQMTNLPVVLASAALGVPLVISTGGAYLWEVGRVVHQLEQRGKHDFALLHCVSLYPAPDETLNLTAIRDMQAAFPYPIGYSDHSLGRTACISAITLGATLIEKHFTLDRNLPGGDNFLSSDPKEFATLVREIRACEAMLGDSGKRPHPNEDGFRNRMRRRLVANADVETGQILTAELVGIKRPLEPKGLSPEFFETVVGRRAARAIRRHEPIDWDSITRPE